ncbi:hypothetical protein K1T71_000646 [Dendrolimus kikuchii]|uniref:Uncharacterized protein n=1 Tax=Dendrolimus kikuchii TaxID=765133 RepID=A0ACC1DJT9_9NEOP|nr:hypothetical protein K1T71_000646 [Dendrolimus kikuchii]
MDISTKCRVCLNGDRRMYSINKTVLQEIWEKLTSARFDSNDGRPVLACYICCAQLRKSHQLRERALQAEELLTDFVINGFEQSKERISLIASLSYDLKYYNVSEPFVSYESEQISKNPLKEIKKEFVEANKEDDKEGNEKYSHIKIKKEKEDYLDSHHHREYPDLVEDESNTHFYAKPPLRNIIVQTKIEVPVIFEKTDLGTPTRKRRAEDVPPTENEMKMKSIKAFGRMLNRLMF